MGNFLNVDWSKIPAPMDDGAAKHLLGLQLPALPLAATDGSVVDLSSLAGLTIVYVYPMTGQPGVPLPEGWDMIPGARGCTPQSCAFRDHFAELRALGMDHLFGLSTQDTGYQREAVERLQLPFPFLSDYNHAFGNAIRLPSFKVEGKTLWKRITLAVRDGRVEHVFYPIFPPDRNAGDAIAWLRSQSH